METSRLRDEFEAMIENMGVDDMPNADMADIASICGCQVAISLLRNVSGMKFTVPKRNAFHAIAKKFIISHFNGGNAKKLVQITGCSEAFVYNIITQENLRRTESRKATFKQLELPLFPRQESDDLTEERSACNG